MDSTETILSVKTPESKLDQSAKENSHPSQDSSDFSQIADQTTTAVVTCGESKGKSNLVYLLKNVLVEKQNNAMRFSVQVEKQTSLQMNLFSRPGFESKINLI